LDRVLLKPRVKLIGNMHGNEPVGRELLVHLANYLPKMAEEGDERAKRILDTTDLYILPTMNPDGFKRGEEGRCSGGGYATGRLSEGRQGHIFVMYVYSAMCVKFKSIVLDLEKQFYLRII
jgi:hypothetical protein